MACLTLLWCFKQVFLALLTLLLSLLLHRHCQRNQQLPKLHFHGALFQVLIDSLLVTPGTHAC